MAEVSLKEKNQERLSRLHLTSKIILDRAEQGLCCLCGGKTEYRKRRADRYCHKCAEVWTVEKAFSLMEQFRGEEKKSTPPHKSSFFWGRLGQWVLRK